MKLKSALGLFTSVLIFSTSIWVFTHSQEITDWWRLRDYNAPAEIIELADLSGMNDEGERIFYIYAPELLPKDQFSGKCNFDEETIILGCYISDEKIYIYDVEDKRLDGIEEVTAAHEMLHAAYDRLSSKDRVKIDSLLLETFKNLNDERINETIASYRKRDPSVVPNELHSILGTEVRNLPEELEEYYKKYFDNRLAVVEFAENYELEFTSLENKIIELDGKLESLKASIDANQTDIELLNQALVIEQSQLERLRSDPEAFNASVPSYNQKVREYNNLLSELRTQIETYNELVSERNSIALEERGLIQALDSNYQEL